VTRVLDAIITVLESAEFTSGIRFGGLAVAAAAIAGLAWYAVATKRAPVAGLALAIAGLLGLADVFDLPQSLVVGTGLLAAAGLVAAVVPWADLVGLVLSIPGALVVASTDKLPDVAWMRPLVVVTIVVGGTAVASFDHRRRERAFGSVLLPLSVVGVYFTVPDTEHLLVLLGAAAAVPLLGWPLPIASLGRPGAYAAVGVLMWAAALDGVGRTSSVVGAAACLGLLLAEPIATLLARRQPHAGRLPGPLGVLPFAIAHGVLVYVASRVAGLGSEPLLAAIIATVALAVAVIALTALARSGPTRASAEPVSLR
jgi:hypothetical protein